MMIITLNLCPTVSFGKTNRIKVNDYLSLKDNLEIKIIEIHYKKENVAKKEEGEQVVVNINNLKDIFLNKAVVISGMEMNYLYLYEYVTIVGQIISDNNIYDFNYNLAGFGYIYSKDWKEPIIYGDTSKELPPPS